MEKGLIRQQVERILDDDGKIYRDVIVALDKGDQGETAVVEAALATIENRSLIVSAQDRTQERKAGERRHSFQKAGEGHAGYSKR